MSSHRPRCDREMLRRSLDDSLSEEQEEEFANHLSACPLCQQELEWLAAGQEAWSQVGDILKREAESRSHAPREADQDAHNDSSCHPENSGDSPADFAVHFLEPSTTTNALGRLGDIDILEIIGRGGMGVVLRGFQQELHRPVAVKILAPHLATSGAARHRFTREAQAAAVIVHPNVMPILTVHSSSRLPYLVMPYVVCESLQQRIDREGPLGPLDVLRISVQTARALAAAHAQGLIHRDIKPANILLECSVDRVLLTDFGLARAMDDATLTKTGIIAGTPQYMSPEQARGESLDTRSDLFSLGSVMYAMCTGRPPFRAETSYGILRRITDTQPRGVREVNSAIPDWLAAILGKLHAKDPADRFSSAEEVAQLLEHCLAHVQQPAAVELPVAVRDLAATSSRHGQTGQEENSSTRLQRLVWPLLIAASVLAIATVLGVWLRKGDWTKNGSPTSASSAVQAVAPADKSHTVPSTRTTNEESSAATWHDGVAEQMLELNHDAAEFELRVSRLWDSEATTAARSFPTNTDPSLDQEIRP